MLGIHLVVADEVEHPHGPRQFGKKLLDEIEVAGDAGGRVADDGAAENALVHHTEREPGSPPGSMSSIFAPICSPAVTKYIVGRPTGASSVISVSQILGLEPT